MQLTHLRNTAFSYLDSSEVYVKRDDKILLTFPSQYMYRIVPVTALQEITKKFVYFLYGYVAWCGPTIHNFIWPGLDVPSLSRLKKVFCSFGWSHADGRVHLVGWCAERWSRSVCCLAMCRGDHLINGYPALWSTGIVLPACYKLPPYSAVPPALFCLRLFTRVSSQGLLSCGVSISLLCSGGW